jgi:hypothetical protein
MPCGAAAGQLLQHACEHESAYTAVIRGRSSWRNEAEQWCGSTWGDLDCTQQKTPAMPTCACSSATRSESGAFCDDDVSIDVVGAAAMDEHRSLVALARASKTYDP